MLFRGKDYRTVWLEMQHGRPLVKMIDQALLPHRFAIHASPTWLSSISAIKDMLVRGAPAIGVTGAFAYAQAAFSFSESNFAAFKRKMGKAKSAIASARPTAVDLKNMLDFVDSKCAGSKSIPEFRESALHSSQLAADLNAEACRAIGEFGNSLLPKKCTVLTHCNAGALACVDHGTALAPIKFAHRSGKKIFAYVDETRPRLQGSLTAWELLQDKIPHCIIADNAAGSLMKSGKIDAVFVGADRIAKNGDFANKIGTYPLAVLARENSVPFYACAPSSSFDLRLKNGTSIPIEQRSEDEVLCIGKTRIHPKGSRAFNPAFDVTPGKYVTAFITEKGVFRRR